MNRIILLILCLPLSLFVACGGEKSPEETTTENIAQQPDGENADTVEAMKTELKSKANEVAQYTEEQKKALMEKKDALVQKMQSTLSEAGSLDNLKGAASNALNKLQGGGDGADTKAVMEKVNTAKENVMERMEALKDATPDNWEELKAKAESALAKFQAALAEAKDQ